MCLYCPVLSQMASLIGPLILHYFSLICLLNATWILEKFLSFRHLVDNLIKTWMSRVGILCANAHYRASLFSSKFWSHVSHLDTENWITYQGEGNIISFAAVFANCNATWSNLKSFLILSHFPSSEETSKVVIFQLNYKTNSFRYSNTLFEDKNLFVDYVRN